MLTGWRAGTWFFFFSDVNISRPSTCCCAKNGCEGCHPLARSTAAASLHAHNGDLPTARRLAREQLDAIYNPADFDAIISNARGLRLASQALRPPCSPTIRFTPREPPCGPKSSAMFSEWLVAIGFRPPTSAATTHAYHVSRGLPIFATGKKITAQPRQIPAGDSPAWNCASCKESTWCCGSAGIYKHYPAFDRRLAPGTQARAFCVQPARPSWRPATPGCHLQIQNGLRFFSGDSTTQVKTPRRAARRSLPRPSAPAASRPPIV